MFLKEDILNVSLSREQYNRRIVVALMVGVIIGVTVTTGLYMIFL